jgi:acetyltransferase-like isoleucine patch superfamily enzyme
MSEIKGNNKKLYDIKGTNNKIITIDAAEKSRDITNLSIIEGLDISIQGNNNIFYISLPFIAQDSKIAIESNNTVVKLGSNPILFMNNNIEIKYGENQRLQIGNNCALHRDHIMLAEDSTLIIGDNCMFGAFAQIYGSDGHCIIDKNTGALLNRNTGALEIGSHCWIGNDALILKKAKIPGNTIVGAKSVVTKAFDEEYTLLAGMPASIVKRGVTWTYESPLDRERMEARMSDTSIDAGKKMITLSSEELRWKVGQQGLFCVYMNGMRISVYDVDWESNNTNIATISNAGLIEAIGIGEALITCSHAGCTSAICRVVVE